MMKLTTAFAAIGLLSTIPSYSFADDLAPGHNDDKKFEYECKLEGCDNGDDDDLKCWVKGTLCVEDNHFDALHRGCNDNDNSIEIKCNNHFKLDEKKVATTIEKGTLWVNADEHKKIATLRVEDFLKALHHGGHHFKADADLLISKHLGNADRLSGECKFKKKEHFNNGAAN